MHWHRHLHRHRQRQLPLLLFRQVGQGAQPATVDCKSMHCRMPSRAAENRIAGCRHPQPQPLQKWMAGGLQLGQQLRCWLRRWQLLNRPHPLRCRWNHMLILWLCRPADRQLQLRQLRQRVPSWLQVCGWTVQRLLHRVRRCVARAGQGPHVPIACQPAIRKHYGWPLTASQASQAAVFVGQPCGACTGCVCVGDSSYTQPNGDRPVCACPPGRTYRKRCSFPCIPALVA